MFYKWALYAETKHDIQIGKTTVVKGVTLQDALKRFFKLYKLYPIKVDLVLLQDLYDNMFGIL